MQGTQISLHDVRTRRDGPALAPVQIATLLGSPLTIVRRRIARGDMRSVRIGWNYRVPWRSFRAYLIRTRLLRVTEW